MIRRLFKIFLLLTVLIVLGIGFGAPAYYSSESGAKKAAEQIGSALGRNVEIGELDIGWFFTSLSLEKLRIANPDGWPDGDFLRADSVALDTKFQKLVSGVVKGSLEGSGLNIHILKRGDATNLDGLGNSGNEGKQKEEEKEGGGGKEDGGDKDDGGPELDLTLELTDSTLIIEDLDKNEKLVVEGVGLSMQMSNGDDQSNVALKIRVKQIDRGGVKVRDLVIDARQDGDFLQLDKLAALLPGKGKLSGTGALRVRGGNDWRVQLKADTVGLSNDMMPLVSAMYPLASSASGQLDGILDASFELSGNGLTWDAMKPTLTGDASIKLSHMNLGEKSVIGMISTLAGRSEGKGPMAINNAGAAFKVENGWLHFNRLSASGDKARYDLAGKVSLDGQLDLTIDALPILKRFGGGSYKEFVGRLKSFPLPIRGTTAKPKLKAPKAKDLLRGNLGGLLKEKAKKALGDEAGGALGGILDGIKKKKEKR